MICEIHQAEMKLIPAGVSKTSGKPYNAFYACQIRECKWKPPQTQTPATGANIAPQRESSERYGLRLAIHGMVNGLLASGKTPQEVSTLLPHLFGLEEDIERRLAKPTSMNVAEAKIQENLPTIDYNEDQKWLDETVPF